MALPLGPELKRADSEKLWQVFQKYASIDKAGEKFMSGEDFVQKYLGLYQEANYNSEAVKLLAGIVDTSKDGVISFPEFQAFEALLCAPDALYKTAFQLFDTNGNGMVSFDKFFYCIHFSSDEFSEVIQQTSLYQRLPFDLDSDLMKLYFGKDKKRIISFPEFSQLLHGETLRLVLWWHDIMVVWGCSLKDFHEEHALQAFRRFDKRGQGFISALDFNDIMVSIKSHLLTPVVRMNLVAVSTLFSWLPDSKAYMSKTSGIARGSEAAGGGLGGRPVSFPYFVAFISLLQNMELIKKIYLNATVGDRLAEVTKGDILH
ncbi:unnamed protein product [Darwinula stevensoni]|uniref:EF-hand domain-containing protein n=1 Tax=Darwinula stevensoni TaxID=69355 RepID=A0A7R9A8P4_9CRUS|nr:unnamed protein product [Darwinula stevensoni]CAG0896588.1 unnamed protein product [Darwinula stevensoni]